MRQTLKAGVQVVTSPQLFPTPPALAARMVELAGIEETHRVLEPSAGTGSILRLIGNRPDKVAVEINGQLVRGLLSGLQVHHGDFLDCNDELGKFDRIVMNPPFADGLDIRHITHALGYLSPGGRVVAICANGPRQNDNLRSIVDARGGTWEELPPDTFVGAGTNVRTVLLTVEG